MEVYAAMVERMDASIGRVLAAIERHGALDDTLIVFLSDNGGNAEQFTGVWRAGAWLMPLPPANRWRFGDNPGTMPGPADTFQTCGPGWSSLQNAPFRLGKHATHEGGIASPLIVHWPAGLEAEAGSLIRQPGHVVDLLPTFLEAAGIDSGDSMLRGSSLMPLLRGSSRQRTPMFFEHEGNRAVIDGRWKLVSDHPRPWELYDLEVDRTETVNLAARHPERVAAMATMYHRFAEETGVAAWPWASPWRRRLMVGALLLPVVMVAVWRRRGRTAQSTQG